jgi:hypothetical protein
LVHCLGELPAHSALYQLGVLGGALGSTKVTVGSTKVE